MCSMPVTNPESGNSLVVAAGTTPHDPGGLLGRDAELERLGGFLEHVRGGASDALVILGDPGAGKTALLTHLVTTAGTLGGFTVLQARCLEAESEIPYSGLADVTRPVRGLIDVLPRIQARALRAALALGSSATAGSGPAGGDQRFAVAIASLTLLAAAAEKGPVVVAVDDAHWLDSASAEALVFTARRLGTEGVGMVFTLRRSEPWPAHFEALPAIGLQGLDAAAAAALVTRVRAHPVPAEVTMRLWAATGGNPLALRSLAATLEEAQLLGKEQIPDPLPVAAAIRHGFVRRMAGLSQACRGALLVAAAADGPQLDVVAAALSASGLGLADLETAESRGLISIRPGEGGLAFDHPLLRSAVYHDSSPSSRRAAHAALARALAAAPERRAWHLALAAAGPDESVAADLADAARQAQHRGGYGGAARALELAARLSPSADRRAVRLYEAAQAAARADQATRVNDLLDAGLAADPDAVLRARMQSLRGRVATFSASPLWAGRLLLAEASRVEGMDAALAAKMRVEAVPAIGVAGRVQEGLTVAIDAHRAAARIGNDDLAARAGLLLGTAQMIAGDPHSDRPLFEASLARLASRLRSAESALDLFLYLSAAAQALSWTGELDRAAHLIAELRERTRDALLPGLLSYVLGMSSEIELRRGRLAAAHAAAAESVQLAADTSAGTQYAYALVRLGAAAAAIGLDEDCRASVRQALAVSEEADMWSVPVHAHAALGLLALGAGDPSEAARTLDQAQRAAERTGLGHPGVGAYAGDHVEALTRAARRPQAEQALSRLQAQARISQGTWELGVTARCRGLLVPTAAADSHFTRALALLEPLSTFEAARTRLCWGESLRRRRQRGQARRMLGQAHETFTRLGAVTWTRQTEIELEASGAAVHRPIPAPARQLTPREFQICALVAQGATNPEIAAKLFLSRKTIEAHLGHIFAKLHVRSRTELTRLIIQSGLGEP
jgi:DNA-binding CsgD family transcriptional regulator/tetratricopeptide (TPR) repeat protein